MNLSLTRNPLRSSRIGSSRNITETAKKTIKGMKWSAFHGENFNPGLVMCRMYSQSRGP
ncbi:MAG: hypothetical protein BWY89_02065 [Bacteroidetes bacterium ADurb.BinA012]|nr:MAG: hypothetical protein BWY89_02065 [Bacteroidetes bacterium ADurb.BinA012]